jgi:hypothetical protein
MSNAWRCGGPLPLSNRRCPGPELESLHDVAGVGGGVSGRPVDLLCESGPDASSEEELPCARSVSLLRKWPSALSISGLNKNVFWSRPYTVLEWYEIRGPRRAREVNSPSPAERSTKTDDLVLVQPPPTW